MKNHMYSSIWFIRRYYNVANPLAGYELWSSVLIHHKLNIASTYFFRNCSYISSTTAKLQKINPYFDKTISGEIVELPLL